MKTKTSDKAETIKQLNRKMKYNEFLKLLLRYIAFVAIVAFIFGCSSLESMTPPIIIDQKDSAIVVVVDKNGDKYTLTHFEKTEYGTAFKEVGDTLIYK
ncbi:MAG: hypothetical protein ABII90_13675 [Bacteroidota bacterium]